MKEVHWKSLLTGFEGHGNPIDDDVAEAWVQRENKQKERYFYHWTVRVFEARL